MTGMTSNRPYLIRALYEWISDNKLTPYIVLRATLLGVHVPKAHIEDGKMILNISSLATRNLVMSNHTIQFDARFNGEPWTVRAPIRAVEAIYAKENSRGMIFDEAFEAEEGEMERGEDDEEYGDGGNGDKGGDKPAGKGKKGTGPHLTIVK